MIQIFTLISPQNVKDASIVQPQHLNSVFYSEKHLCVGNTVYTGTVFFLPFHHFKVVKGGFGVSPVAGSMR